VAALLPAADGHVTSRADYERDRHLDKEVHGEVARLDVIRGTDGPDVLKGTSGGDLIYARGGNDIVRGFHETTSYLRSTKGRSVSRRLTRRRTASGEAEGPTASTEQNLRLHLQELGGFAAERSREAGPSTARKREAFSSYYLG